MQAVEQQRHWQEKHSVKKHRALELLTDFSGSSITTDGLRCEGVECAGESDTKGRSTNIEYGKTNAKLC